MTERNHVFEIVTTGLCNWCDGNSLFNTWFSISLRLIASIPENFDIRLTHYDPLAKGDREWCQPREKIEKTRKAIENLLKIERMHPRVFSSSFLPLEFTYKSLAHREKNSVAHPFLVVDMADAFHSLVISGTLPKSIYEDRILRFGYVANNSSDSSYKLMHNYKDTETFRNFLAAHCKLISVSPTGTVQTFYSALRGNYKNRVAVDSYHASRAIDFITGNQGIYKQVIRALDKRINRITKNLDSTDEILHYINNERGLTIMSKIMISIWAGHDILADVETIAEDAFQFLFK